MSRGTRVVVIAVTRHGTKTAQRLAMGLPEAEVHVAARWRDQVPGAQAIATPLAEALPRFFREPSVGGLIVVLAVGATVRLLAPWLQDIITTASESDGVLTVDLLGADAGWRIEATPAALRHVAAAVVNGDPVGVYQDVGDTSWQTATNVPSNVRVLSDLRWVEEMAPLLVISDRVLGLPGETECTVVYRPPTLVAGVGCSRGATADDIANVVDRALAQGGLARASLARLATLDRRLDEPGVVAFAQRSGLPLVGYTAELLAGVAGALNPSAVVEAAVGTPGVCEPAALLASGATVLLVPKVKTARATAAIARLVPGATGL